MTEEQEITATEAARRLGVTDKTLRKWIAQGKISARRISDTRLALKVEDVQALAESMERATREDIYSVLSSFSARLTEIEYRLTTLESLLAEKKQIGAARSPRPAPVVTPRASVVTEMGETPEGLEISTVFAGRHFPALTGDKVGRLVQTLREGGHVPMIEGEYKLGKAKARWALDAAGRRAFYEACSERDGFQPCADCPH